MKILIVDDHPIVRAGLKRMLADRPDIEFRETDAGKEALGIFREFRPDLVILDLNLPDMGGLELIRRLTLEETKARILVFSMHDDAIYAMRALQAGAAGYVSKNEPPAQILEAIARVADGHTYVGHELAQELALFNVRADAHPLEDLSRRDLEILRLLGEGRSLQQIADTLGVSYKTVANNCTQIRTKLGAKRTADLIRIAIQNRIVADS
ncbi:MAG TPA: response regulator transcription factor [Alphaproteobacteria bacterium]|jgi:DNA-binding NarL/FixJ family response regulator|nr:response regulator transcription factor [Alphaproteobacteria bacterium]